MCLSCAPVYVYLRRYVGVCIHVSGMQNIFFGVCICLPDCRSVCLSARLSVGRSVCLTVGRSVCPTVCRSVCPTVGLCRQYWEMVMVIGYGFSSALLVGWLPGSMAISKSGFAHRIIPLQPSCVSPNVISLSYCWFIPLSKVIHLFKLQQRFIFACLWAWPWDYRISCVCIVVNHFKWH